MAKFYGNVGYVEYKTVRPGVSEEVPTEYSYYGDVLRNTRKYEPSDHLNDDLNVNNQISIVADAFSYDHFFAMRYVKWMGAYWKVTNVEVKRPRLILTIGGVYNGPTVTAPEHPGTDSGNGERTP